MKKFVELKELILNVEKDAVKFYEKGNRTAGTRLRKALMRSKTLAHQIRQDVSVLKRG